jgi:hypothetical protein
MSSPTGDSPDVDVAVVGGGPSGSGVAVFTARYGFDTAVFDRGNAALPRAAIVENYPGFPGGIDPETLAALFEDHVREAGAEYVADHVTAVTRAEDRADAFVVETQDERELTARYVVAASWYDGEYLRPLVGDGAFEVHDHGEGAHEHFDPDYADSDGRTPVDGLYVAAPAGERNAQAIVAAGHGAHVARTLTEDHRRARGYPDGVAEHYDWLRPASIFDDEWGERDRWREWFHDRVPDDHGTDEDRLVELRERYIDDAFATRRTDDEIETLRNRAHDRLLDHIDDDRILERAREIESGRETDTTGVDR